MGCFASAPAAASAAESDCGGSSFRSRLFRVSGRADAKHLAKASAHAQARASCAGAPGHSRYYGAPHSGGKLGGAPNSSPRRQSCCGECGCESECEAAPGFGVDGLYKVVCMLGQGASGETWLCVDRATGREVAIKFMQRPIPEVELPRLEREIKLHALTSHAHVNLVTAESLVLSDSHLGLVMEACRGGTLTDRVTQLWQTRTQRRGLFMREDEARYFFKQYISAVQFLHKACICHRDVKLDNLLLDGPEPPRLRLCDFGYADAWATGCAPLMRLPIGTAAYMSPQLTECAARLRPGGCYDGAKADVWACGVTLFAMLHGAFPFEGDPGGGPSCCGGDGGPTWRTRHADVSAGLHRLSPAVVDLLDRMLDVDEASRASLDDVAAHEWLAAPLPTNMTAALDAAAAEQASKQGVTTEWAAEDLGTAGQAASEGGAEDATGSSGAGVASTGGGHVCVNASISAMVREAGQPPPRPRHAPGCGGNGHSSAAMPRWLELLPSGGASVGHRPARRAAGSLNSSGSNTSNGSNVGSGSNSGTTGSL
uniref:Protein kinase domain-containing protein n=1 Tax=Chlamydomonas euryale TaxID=1486919 RepID=A0A7R9YW68_9CHLO|mmetsp:Transcript_30395/g.90108  ORF Transcript_30395/g.90108 Transcript_30395/m.90108 type:complete len:541 (+) Transcript_30395:354-1976(+)